MPGEGPFAALRDGGRLGAGHQPASGRRACGGVAAVADTAFLSDMLGSADPDRLLGDRVTVLQATKAAVRRLDDGALNGQPLVEASVRDAIGRTLGQLARYDEAEANLRRALALVRHS